MNFDKEIIRHIKCFILLIILFNLIGLLLIIFNFSFGFVIVSVINVSLLFYYSDKSHKVEVKKNENKKSNELLVDKATNKFALVIIYTGIFLITTVIYTVIITLFLAGLN